MKCIAFDIGGTLAFTEKPSFFRNVLARLGDRAESTYDCAVKYFLTRPTEFPDSLIRFCLECNVDFSKFEDLMTYVRDNVVVYGDAVPALSQLSTFQKVTFSNVSSVDCCRMTQLGMGRFFKREFSSFKIGFAKPHVECFRHVERALSRQSSDMVMVGDSLRCDVRPARAIGWTTVLVDRSENILDDSAADFRIGSLAELVHVCHEM